MTTTEQPIPEPGAGTDPGRPERRSQVPWLIAAAAVVAAVLLGRPLLRALLPAPKLVPALRLQREGKLPEAEAKLAAYLAYDPANPEAALSLAQVKLDLDPPKPAEALATLKAIRPQTATQAATALVFRGRALEALHHPGQAEAAYLGALQVDPVIGEAGWLLLQLYYMQGREDEARALALRLSRVEPDPGDRVRLLLEPIRYEAEPLAAAGVIPMFAEALKHDPDDRPAALAYYRALAKDGTDIEQALAGLKGLVARHPEDLACQDALMFALDRTGDLDGLEAALKALPSSLSDRPPIAGHRGRLALRRGDYRGAIAALEKAVAADPSDAELLHLLGEAHRLSGGAAEAQAVRVRETALEAARVELRGIKGKEQEEGRPGLFEEATGRRDLGYVPDLDLYRRLAANREAMGHSDEALAWHRLILRADRDDPESLKAVARLGGKEG